MRSTPAASSPASSQVQTALLMSILRRTSGCWTRKPNHDGDEPPPIVTVVACQTHKHRQGSDRLHRVHFLELTSSRPIKVGVPAGASTVRIGSTYGRRHSVEKHSVEDDLTYLAGTDEGKSLPQSKVR